MGWSTSIHIATSDVATVVAALERLGEHNCLVGHSGINWVGVYSERCEMSAGLETPNLASKLTDNLGYHVLGVCLHEEGFKYWLFLQGKLLDQHPSGRLSRLFSGSKGREILNLAKSPQAMQQMEAALVPKKRPLPHEVLGMTEDEFNAHASRELARFHTMSPAERDEMEKKYSRLQPPYEEDLKILCEAVGITEHNWNYSELVEPDETDEGSEMRSKMGLTPVP